MAVSGIEPVVKVWDTNGLPIVGAVLKIYQPGTTTYLPIFSDSALTIPMTNPLQGANASNANGWFPRFYMASGIYKMRAETAPIAPATSGTLIWEYDNIDSGTSAGSGALPIISGGTGATTAAAARANLGAASTSDVTGLASQLAGVTASLQSAIAFPQGRLTLTSQTPVLTASVTAVSTVFYTPYSGQLCPIFDGAQFNAKIFPELSLTLNTSHVLNSIYDFYVINDATNGVTLVTSAAWSSIIAGTCSRSGTADLTRLNGLLVNAAPQTMRNGATTYSVAANQGTYLGSIYMDGTAGQVSCLLSYGQSRKWGVWNAYNRVPISMRAGDPSGGWTYATATIRPSDNSTANSLTTFTGLPEESAHIEFTQALYGTTGVLSQYGIGFNSTTAFSGLRWQGVMQANDNAQYHLRAPANYQLQPTIGINVFTSLEVGGASINFAGTETNMLLTASYRG